MGEAKRGRERRQQTLGGRISRQGTGCDRLGHELRGTLAPRMVRTRQVRLTRRRRRAARPAAPTANIVMDAGSGTWSPPTAEVMV